MMAASGQSGREKLNFQLSLRRRGISDQTVLRALEALEPAMPSAPHMLRRWVIGGYIWQGYRQGLRELT